MRCLFLKAVSYQMFKLLVRRILTQIRFSNHLLKDCWVVREWFHQTLDVGLGKGLITYFGRDSLHVLRKVSKGFSARSSVIVWNKGFWKNSTWGVGNVNEHSCVVVHVSIVQVNVEDLLFKSLPQTVWDICIIQSKVSQIQFINSSLLCVIYYLDHEISCFKPNSWIWLKIQSLQSSELTKIA